MPKRTLALALLCLVWTTTAAAESDPADNFDERFDVLITVRDVEPLIEAVTQFASAAEPEKADEIAALFDAVPQMVVGRACLALELPEGYGSFPDFLLRVPVDESAVTVADLVGKHLPALLGTERTVIEEKGGIGEIGPRGNDERLYWAVRGGVFYASSRRETVQAVTAAAGRRPPRSLGKTDDYRALSKHIDRAGDVTVYVRLAKLTELTQIGPPPENDGWNGPGDEMGNVIKNWLAPDQFRAVGFSWKADGKTASGRLVALTKRGRRGLAGLVDVPNAPMNDLDRIPENCQLFYWSAPLGRRMVERTARFMTELDPDIATEFENELAEFSRELDVDLEKDVFENIGEQTYGVRMPGAGLTATYSVIAVKDADALQRAADALARYNETPLRKLEGAGQTYHVIPSRPPLFYMLHDGRALMSNNLGDVQEMVALTAEAEPGVEPPRTLADAEVFAKLRERLPDENVFVFAADMHWVGRAAGTLLAWVPEARAGLSRPAVNRFLAPLRKAEPGLTFGVALRNEPNAYVLHVEDLSGSSLPLLAGAAKLVAEPITEARREARGNKSRSNLRNIGMACLLWRDQHGEGKLFPPSLKALLDDGVLEDPKALLCPGSGTQLKEGEFVSDYDSLFDRAGFSPEESDVPASLMIAWEKESFFEHDRNAVFADFHTDRLPEDEFQEHLKRVEEWLEEHKANEENHE